MTTTAIIAGVAVGGVATAAPVGANESMSTKLQKLRLCESGNHYSEDTGNGYYGAYQFSASTWHGLGYHGLPDHAKSTTQDHAATTLHSRQGWRPWPSCARREHL